jgi:hypothetical protein
MTDSPMTGFILKTPTRRPDVNAAGGYRDFHLIAVAQSADAAKHIAQGLGFPGCTVIESGPAVLKRARELGVNDNDARALD